MSSVQEPDERLAVSAPLVVGLLRAVGGTPADAAHLGEAIRAHRKMMRAAGVRIPTSLDLLQVVCAAVAVGPRRATEGQPGPELAAGADTRDGGGMPDLLKAPETAARLRCSERTLKRRVQAGELVPVRHGRIVRFRVADVDAYLDRSR